MKNRLRELRKARGLTSITLAEVLGLSESAVRYIERGERGFSMESLDRACRYFGVSVDYLLGKSADEMFADFVSSVEQNWRTVSFDATGEPTQVYTDDVSRPLQVKFDILRLMNDTDNEVVLQSVYEYFHACAAPRAFTETSEENSACTERIEKVAKIVKLLFAMDSASLDLILQTAALQRKG